MSKLLVRNQHHIERMLRVAAGLGLLTLTVVGPKTPLGYLGLIPLATGLFGACPVYALLGLSTRRAPKR
jgi:hypothetical protein